MRMFSSMSHREPGLGEDTAVVTGLLTPFVRNTALFAASAALGIGAVSAANATTVSDPPRIDSVIIAPATDPNEMAGSTTTTTTTTIAASIDTGAPATSADPAPSPSVDDQPSPITPLMPGSPTKSIPPRIALPSPASPPTSNNDEHEDADDADDEIDEPDVD